MSAPDWLAGEMPAGYHNRLAEIQRLSADLQEMDRYGRLLWEVGPQLTEAVRDAFVAMRYEAELISDANGTAVGVRLDPRRRLLLYVAPRWHHPEEGSGTGAGVSDAARVD